MLPSTVISERSLDPQIAASATPADSSSLLITIPTCGRRPLATSSSRCFHLDGVAVAHRADRVVRPGHHLVDRRQALQDFEELVTGDADLDRHEFHLAGAHDEHPFGFLARL